MEKEKVENRIIKLASEKKRLSTANVVELLGVSRQYANRLLRELVQKKRLIKSGEYRYTAYALPENTSYLGKHIKKRFINKNLAESEVLKGIVDQAPFIYTGNDNAGSIFDYAFSEMLNNAIEHSNSKFIEIEVNTLNQDIVFKIRDFGIGVFKNVMKKRKLPEEIDAIVDLLKGKVTTAPEAHSGEGIFFTSKAADIFILESFDLRLRIDNTIPDIFIEEISPSKKGTEVTFQISKKTVKHLTEIFTRYQTDPEEYAFDKTEIKVKLYTMGSIYISRSQARRLLSGLEKFKRVILDFDKVPTVGQAFADEIFRVFKHQHPKTQMVPENMNSTVSFMVGRVGKS